MKNNKPQPSIATVHVAMTNIDRRPVEGELRIEASGCPVRIAVDSVTTFQYIDKLSHSTRVFVETPAGDRFAVQCAKWEGVQANA